MSSAPTHLIKLYHKVSGHFFIGRTLYINSFISGSKSSLELGNFPNTAFQNIFTSWEDLEVSIIGSYDTMFIALSEVSIFFDENKNNHLFCNLFDKKQERLPAVYIIRHKKNGHFYIGSTVDLYSRLKYHRLRLKNGKHDNSKLLEVYTSWEDFEIWWEYGKTKEEVSKKEQVLLDKEFLSELCCNISNLSEPNWLANGAVDAAAKTWQSGKRINFWKGKKLSEEAKRKIGDKNRGRIKSEETRKKLSKPVSLDGVVYPTIKAAAKTFNVAKSTIRRRITGELKGYPNWFFIDK